VVHAPLEDGPEDFDFEICVPVTAPVVAVGRVLPGSSRPQGRAHDYRGPYEGLGDAWGEFRRVDRENHFDAGLDLYEFYVAGPESSPDPGELAHRTESTLNLIAYR